MNQNLVSIVFSPEILTKLDEAIGVIEQIVVPFPRLSADEVRNLAKMGDKSEPFCRRTLDVLEQNQGILPPDFDLQEARRDMDAFETLQPRLRRMRDFMAKLEDTDTALGSDILTAALEGYALMKLFSKSESLDELRDAMAVRRGSNRKPAPPKSGQAAA